MGWVEAPPHIARTVSRPQRVDSRPRNGWQSFLGQSEPTPRSQPEGPSVVRVAVGNKALMKEQDVDILPTVDSYMRRMEVRAAPCTTSRFLQAAAACRLRLSERAQRMRGILLSASSPCAVSACIEQRAMS